ncbi:hypothetical protein GGI25_005547 [Coemansia spiralis]|uniref:Uncharacterized protein n=2 Tax=Coemansia TaxID=4863 RepID=A0A9W8G3P9_9FUNG|nr:hypothetical protein GGI25_005547 [Coemansia spiralis]
MFSNPTKRKASSKTAGRAQDTRSVDSLRNENTFYANTYQLSQMSEDSWSSNKKRSKITKRTAKKLSGSVLPSVRTIALEKAIPNIESRLSLPELRAEPIPKSEFAIEREAELKDPNILIGPAVPMSVLDITTSKKSVSFAFAENEPSSGNISDNEDSVNNSTVENSNMGKRLFAKARSRGRFSATKNLAHRARKERAWTRLCTKLENEAETSPVALANRTMMGLLMDRELDLTRSILINGDSGTNRITKSNESMRTQRINSMVTWPATDFYRYINDFSLDRYSPMGINPLKCSTQEYNYISLEEPGDELDAHRLRALYGNNHDNTDADGFDVDDSHANENVNPIDESVISNSNLNGGIGLILRKNSNPNVVTSVYCDDGVQFLTKHHITKPWIQAPRYSRVPLPDEHSNGLNITDASCSSDLTQLVDMTRAQVLNQVLKHNTEISKNYSISKQLPLSKFVSSTVAEEAVNGVMRTWFKTSEIMQEGLRTQSVRRLYPGTCTTQWYSILEAALAAGMPPEVVARSYHRLEKLCDVVSPRQDAKIADTISNSSTHIKRKYTRNMLET